MSETNPLQSATETHSSQYPEYAPPDAGLEGMSRDGSVNHAPYTGGQPSAVPYAEHAKGYAQISHDLTVHTGIRNISEGLHQAATLQAEIQVGAPGRTEYIDAFKSREPGDGSPLTLQSPGHIAQDAVRAITLGLDVRGLSPRQSQEAQAVLGMAQDALVGDGIRNPTAEQKVTAHRQTGERSAFSAETARAVAEQMRPSAEIRTAARKVLHEEVARRRVSDLAGHDAASIDAAVEYLDWRMFADVEAPPPPMVTVQDRHVKLASNGTRYASVLYEMYGTTLAEGSSVDEVYGQPYDVEAITKATEAHINAHPFYQAMQSFVAPAEQQPHMRLRNQAELQIAASQAEQDVRRKHGIPAGDPLSAHPNANRSLQRSINWLEDEEIKGSKKNQQTANPFQRARKYLESLLDAEEMASLRQSTMTTDKRSVEDLGNVVTSKIRTLFLADLSPQELAVSDPLNTFMGQMIRSVYLAHSFVEQGKRKWDDPQLNSNAFSRITSLANINMSPQGEGYYVEATIDKWVSRPTTFTELVRQDLESYGQLNIDKSDYLDVKASFAAEQGSGVAPYFTSDLMVASAEDGQSAAHNIEALAQKEPFGRVLKYDLPNAARRVARMLQPYPNWNVATGNEVANDVVIQIDSLSRSSPPFTIAGLKPEHIYGGQVHFAYDPESDPYTLATIPLPENGSEKLAKIYEAAGLQSLAVDMRTSVPQTAAELEALLKRGAEYRMDGNGSTVRTTTIQELADAYRSEDGVLQFQCTGAAQLLKSSLQELYGVESARVISGQVVRPGSTEVGPIAHAQVMFTTKGKLYYMDSTPVSYESMDRFGEEAVPTEVEVKSQENHLETKPVVLVPETEAEPNLEPAPYTVDDAKEKTNFIRDTELLPLLYTWFDVPKGGSGNKEKLYKSILALHQGDPIRRTLTLAHSIVADTMNPSDISTLKDYIQTLQKAKPNNAVFKFIAKYDPTKLRALEGIIGGIERAYSQVDTAEKV